ncbi:MAG: HAD family hydrolase [Desulfohalobiaceae bacterium]|nr:HAD family hydrolase [Desulfohalobiaceae bacterium]
MENRNFYELKGVFFDFGQTLVDSADGFRAAEKRAQGQLFSKAGLDDWDAFIQVYRQIRKDLHEQSIFSRREIWAAVCKQFSFQPEKSVLRQMENEYWHKVRTMTNPFPEAEEVLSALSPKYRLGVITNTQGEGEQWRHRVHSFPTLTRFFQTVVVAGQGRIPAKPAREPFMKALNELGILPREAIYVGDDYRIDICGARAVGMRPVWLKHKSVARTWPSGDPEVPVISSLESLKRVEELI